MNVRRGLRVMGVPQTPVPSPHLYPQELQLKLYQAFIFSIPILFSIILFLLFYLFYLKRRASSLSASPPHILPRTANPPATYPYHSSDLRDLEVSLTGLLSALHCFIHYHQLNQLILASLLLIPPQPCRLDLKVQFLDKLPRILFDEDLKARDSVCCVCLGEFEMKEELLQVSYCKHVFHIDCIHHWLQSNSTCPLCRCSIIPTTKFLNLAPPIVSEPPQQGAIISGSPSHIVSLPPQPEDEASASSNTTHF